MLFRVTASELLLLARCTLRVLRDSEETDGIHVAEELTGRARYAAIRRELFAAGEGRELLHDRAELRSDQVDNDAAMPARRHARLPLGRPPRSKWPLRGLAGRAHASRRRSRARLPDAALPTDPRRLNLLRAPVRPPVPVRAMAAKLLESGASLEIQVKTPDPMREAREEKDVTPDLPQE